MWADLIVALRSLRRSPLFTGSAVLTLALGIGASSAIFTVIHAVLIRPLPYREPAELVRIWEAHPVEGNERALVAAANFNDWRARSRAFSGLALFHVFTHPTVIGVGDASLQAIEAVVTNDLFDVLGVHPSMGRQFGRTPEKRGPLVGTELIVSHAFWQRALGGTAGAIGRPIRIEGAAGSVIVGVMPAGFSFPQGTDFWTPMDAGRAGSERRDSRLYGVIGRLAPKVSLATARAQLQSIAAALAREHPDTNRGWTVAVRPLHESVVGDYRLALMTLFAAVSFVLLVGCTNVSNLLLARGISRRGEIAVRSALGASRMRLLRLLLAEAVVLGVLGAVAGVAFAKLLLPLLIQLAGSDVPRLANARVDLATIAFSVAVAFLAVILTGLLPALRQSRAELRGAFSASGERSLQATLDQRLQHLVSPASSPRAWYCWSEQCFLPRRFSAFGPWTLDSIQRTLSAWNSGCRSTALSHRTVGSFSPPRRATRWLVSARCQGYRPRRPPAISRSRAT